MQTLSRNLLMTFTLLLLGTLVFAQNDTLIDGLKKRRNRDSPCSRYWNGTMKYTTEPYLGINIVRKGSKQIETNTITGQKSIFKVKWDGSCNYILTFKKSNMPTRFKKGWQVKYEIYECYEEYYEWEASIHGIMYWGQVTKELSKLEKRAKEKEAEYAAKKARTDSIQAAKEAVRTAKEDSIRKSKGLPTLAEEKALKEKQASEKGAAPAKGEEKGAADKGEKPAKGEKAEAPEKNSKEKGDKPAKEKKEKPPKEKKEKAPKEKKEKPAKEKKEKPPKPEKPAKEE